MTVIRPNSVAGINSITVQSGNSLSVHKANGELIRTITANSGVSTFSSISVGTATTDNSAGKSINIGLGASISQHTDNTLSLGTGGDERARIDSSGRLMVGHNSSLAIGGGDNSPLQVSATSSVVFGGARYVNSSSGPFLSLAKSRATTAGSNTIVQDGDELGTILFAGDDGTDLISKGAQIQGQVDGTPGSNDMPGRLVFYTTADNANSPTERLRIDSSGRLLLGTTTEGHTNADDLTIATSGNTGITIRSGTSNGGNIFFSDATSGTGEYAGMISYDHNDNIMTFATTDGTERLRIDSDGKLKIGTTATPTQSGAINVFGTDQTTSQVSVRRGSGDAAGPRLHFQKSRNTTDGSHTVVQSGDVLGQIVFAGNDAGGPENGALISAEVDGTPGGNDMPGRLVFSTTPDGSDTLAERVRITNGGRVHIRPSNTFYTMNSSSSDLVVGDGGGGRGITIWTASGADNQTLSFQTNESLSRAEGEISYGPTNTTTANDRNAMMFRTNSNERMRITSAGDVCINCTSATGNLQVMDTSANVPHIRIETSDGGSKRLDLKVESSNGIISSEQSSQELHLKSTSHTKFYINGTQEFTISGTNGRLERSFGGGSGAGSDLDGMWFNNDQAASGTFVRFWQTSGSYGANQIGSISHTANNTAYNTSSDYRLKENINAITDAITRLKTLKPSRFNFKTEPSVTVDGFIAHEVTAVPEAITGTKDEVDSNGDPLYQGIDQSKLVPLLTAALQEAVTKIETLETKVAALEGG